MQITIPNSFPDKPIYEASYADWFIWFCDTYTKNPSFKTIQKLSEMYDGSLSSEFQLFLGGYEPNLEYTLSKFYQFLRERYPQYIKHRTKFRRIK